MLKPAADQPRRLNRRKDKPIHACILLAWSKRCLSIFFVLTVTFFIFQKLKGNADKSVTDVTKLKEELLTKTSGFEKVKNELELMRTENQVSGISPWTVVLAPFTMGNMP